MSVYKLLGSEWESMFPAHIHDLGQDFWEAFIGKVVSPDDFQLLESRPSIVESSLKDRFFRSLVAFALKAPWYVFGEHYTLVGGWEVFVRRDSDVLIGIDSELKARQ